MGFSWEYASVDASFFLPGIDHVSSALWDTKSFAELGGIVRRAMCFSATLGGPRTFVRNFVISKDLVGRGS